MIKTMGSKSRVEMVEKELEQSKERLKPKKPAFPNLLNRSSVKGYVHAQKLRIWSFVLNMAIVRWILIQIQMILTNILRVGPLPPHVSFIMDGNRRNLGIKTVSAYAFSIENFNRPQEEVDTLTGLLAEKLDEVARRACDRESELYGLRLRVVGERSRISKSLNDRISRVERLTDEGDIMTLYICFPYTSRNDIYHAIYNCAESCKYLNSPVSDIDETFLTNNMFMKEQSNKCDLLIRTSGHTRLSDYMLWQAHENGVIEFSNTLWPDFDFFEFFKMLLKWSFFTSVRRKQLNNVSLRSQTLSFFKRTLIPFKRKQVSYEDLPEPPQAVSVVQRS